MHLDLVIPTRLWEPVAGNLYRNCSSMKRSYVLILDVHVEVLDACAAEKRFDMELSVLQC
jgi:hypothetical protein